MSKLTKKAFIAFKMKIKWICWIYKYICFDNVEKERRLLDKANRIKTMYSGAKIKIISGIYRDKKMDDKEMYTGTVSGWNVWIVNKWTKIKFYFNL